MEREEISTTTFSPNKSGINFTDSAYSVLYSVVDDPAFRETDADIIFDALRRRLAPVSFGDFLKRYLYVKTSPDVPFGEVDDEYYRRVIVQSFRERGTPATFVPGTAKVSMMAKNWLRQKTVRRDVVFILGFGLGMTGDDVNSFLTKAIGEQGIRPDDPFERTCSYSYARGYSFDRFRMLFDAARRGEPFPGDLAGDDLQIVRRVSSLMKNDGAGCQTRARKVFGDLFARATDAANRLLTADSSARSGDAWGGAGKIERVLLSAVPKGDHGNLKAAGTSSLSEHLSLKRPSRQRLWCLSHGKMEPDRFDVITLNFLIFSENPTSDRVGRYEAFASSCDELLAECGFGPLYVVNPYECFILMCILSEDPLGTYSDVLERSYDK